MDVKDLIKTAKDMPSYQFKRRLNDLVRRDSKYANLDSKNKKTILDLINKHSSKIRSGWGISSDTIRRESYKLYQNRLKSGMSEEDIKDAKEILNLFKK